MRKKLFALILILSVLTGLSSCHGSGTKASQGPADPSDYIGDVNYSATAAALVYEQIPGEEEGFCGIQYHEIADPKAFLEASADPVCLYFYYSLSSENGGVTAGVEDLAQSLDGQLLFVAIDGAAEDQLATEYEVEGFPEFVLIVPGRMTENFGSKDRENWTTDEVEEWIRSRGFTPDYSKLQ